VDTVVAEYEAQLRRRLTQHHVSVREHPTISHAEVVKRAIAKRPPFNQQGQGYRDTLIWYTILELVADPDDWFVTVDNDYIDSDGNIRESLLDELDMLHVPRERLRRYSAIEDCVNDLVAVTNEAVAELSQQLNSDAGYYNALSDEIATLLSSTEL